MPLPRDRPSLVQQSFGLQAPCVFRANGAPWLNYSTPAPGGHEIDVCKNILEICMNTATAFI